MNTISEAKRMITIELVLNRKMAERKPDEIQRAIQVARHCFYFQHKSAYTSIQMALRSGHCPN